jgi:hypothetical protein
MPITLNNAGRAKLSKKSRLRESAQGDKWSFCLTAGKIGPRIRREQSRRPLNPHSPDNALSFGAACAIQI